MSQNIYAMTDDRAVAGLGVEARARFITRTYAHLFGAIAAFTAIEIALFKSGVAERIAAPLLHNWWIALGLFVIAGWIAGRAAMVAKTPAVQYLALAGYVAVESLIFVPILFIAQRVVPEGGGSIIQSAALLTITGFSILTFIAFTTRKDFSFLRGIVMWGMGIAMLLILGGMIFGFQLGMFFSVGMVALAGAAILYDTSNVLHHYPEDRHIAASLQLFASVALMFYYVLMLLIQLQSND